MEGGEGQQHTAGDVWEQVEGNIMVYKEVIIEKTDHR